MPPIVRIIRSIGSTLTGEFAFFVTGETDLKNCSDQKREESGYLDSIFDRPGSPRSAICPIVYVERGSSRYLVVGTGKSCERAIAAALILKEMTGLQTK
jgi:hypothetical protein